MKKTWFQQEGATHCDTNVILKILREEFGQRVISHQMTLAWLPRSPDITRCDFLMEYVKSTVFESLANNLIDLKTQIEAVIKGIFEQLLEDVTKSVCHYFRKCIDSNGAHLLQNVAFKIGIKLHTDFKWHSFLIQMQLIVAFYLSLFFYVEHSNIGNC